MSTFNIPDKLITLSEKQKDKKAYYRNVMDAYIRNSVFGNSKSKDSIRDNYKIYNGEKIKSHYAGFEDPYGTMSTSNPMPLNDVKPWNILRSNIDIVINEKEKRPWNFMASLVNPDVTTTKNMKMQEEIRKALVQKFINMANENGIATGIESQPIPEIETIMAKYNANYLDQRVMEAQKILNVAISEEMIKEKLNRIGMKDWCIAGEINTWKGISFNDFVYEVINPVEIDFIQGPNVKYGRDAEAAIRRVLMPKSQIVDNFRDILTETQLRAIINNEPGTDKTPISRDMSVQRMIYNEDNLIMSGDVSEVIHCTWRGFHRVGVVDYIDEFGINQSMEVDETFEEEVFPYEIIDIKWDWRTCIEECYRIDNRYYVGEGVVPWTSRQLDNRSLCPLPYNRARFSDRNSDNTSLLMDAYIYQFFWNVYKAKLERLISTDKGQIAIVDKAALFEWGLGEADMDKTMYYIDTTKILFIDSRRDDAGKFTNWGSKIDMGQSQTIMALISVLNSLRMELDLSMGITPQRRGDVSPSAGKAATEYALEKSYTVSEGIFSDFEIFEEIELNDVINIAKIVYSRNKKGMYIVDQMPTFLEQEGPDISEEDLTVKMSRATKDKSRLDAARALIQPFAQNIGKPGVTPTMIMSMIESENISSIKVAMERADSSIKAYEKQLIEQEMLANQQKTQAEMADKEAQRQFDANENALDREARILEARIKSAGFEDETLISDIDTSTVMDAANKVRESLEKNAIAREKLSLDKKKHDDEMKDREKERQSKEKLAKISLKNKVVGEK